MKNRIIALMLAVLTLLTSCIVAVPAAASSTDATPAYESATNASLNANYASAQEKVAAEIAAGYTYLYAQNDSFALYANKYTGEVYLKNIYTGQYLTTNPVDPAKSSSLGATAAAQRADMLSQIWIDYTEVQTSVSFVNQNSFEWAATKGQVSVSKIKNGIRVEYVMGDTVARYAVPEALLAEDYLNTIVIPMQEEVLSVFAHLEELLPSVYANASASKLEKAEYTGAIGDVDAFKKYVMALSSVTTELTNAYDKALKAADTAEKKEALFLEVAMAGVVDEHAALPNKNLFKKWITGITADYMSLTSYYTKIDPNATAVGEEALKVYPALGETDPATGKYYVIYTLDSGLNATKKISLQNILTNVQSDYTVDTMLAQEARVGFKFAEAARPVFRFALEYVLDEDGMSYTLPANSISFDESMYRLDKVSILRYFGANDRYEEGYLFYPDGSGALINNEDVTTTRISQKVYGYDYAYSDISGKKTQSVRLPVYGAVNTDVIGGNEVTTGFFAIITEGDSLVTLVSGISDTARYLSTYQIYTPRPSDNYSISGASNIPIFSDIKYTGNYTTKIVMLLDPTLKSLVIDPTVDVYTASYVEMARYYRNYLMNVTEQLTALTEADVNSRIPLFIESYGTLETIEKILTFPVEVDVALTTFGDIQTMHSELAEAGIGNIKFRLIGFYNDGVEGKYPKNLKFMRQVGGKKGFKKLLKYAEENAESGVEIILGVDLMYNYVHWGIGGISKKKTTVRSMDNRYASKQMYDTVYQGFFSYFSLCVSADRLSGLFNKFNKKLSKYDLNGISLDYMAEDLTSNFDEDNMFDREEAKSSIISTLANISSKYDTVLSTGGNAYALKYLDYLLNAPVDSSRYFCASRVVPFYGMVMHGSLEYAGTAFNETGNPEYELLRAIESGSAMYYILCYRNTELMKEDHLLSDHYSANYDIWKNDLIYYYNVLDYAIGDLQTAIISNHQFLISERVITDAERLAAFAKLENEYFALMEAELNETIKAKGAYVRALIAAGEAYAAAADDAAKQAVLDDLAAQIVGGLDADAAGRIAKLRAENSDLTDGGALKQLVDGGVIKLTAGQSIRVSFNLQAILADIAKCFDVDFSAAARAEDAILDEAFTSIWNRLLAFIDDNSTDFGNLAVSVSGVTDYASKSKLSYFTQSLSTDADYKMTDYSLDDGSVVMVTYQLGDETVRFLLNFSIFTVNVSLDGEILTLDKYEFVRLDARADGVADPR